MQAIGKFETGPYIQAALFCERVLDEKDNVKSLIRVIDRMNVQAVGQAPPEKMPEVERELILVLMFKSGEATGPVPIKLTLTRPSGLVDKDPVWEGTVHFEGGTRGHNLVLRVRTQFKNTGPYWYNVYVGDSLATRIPYEVIYTTMRVSGQAPTQPGP